MKFQETALKDAFIIEVNRFADERGYFAEVWREDLAALNGISDHFSGANLSYNRHAGTIRGLHAQKSPYAQTKLVRCVQGRIQDVIVDIRPESPTFRQWISVDLSAENLRMLYVPKGFLHGFQTLEDHTTVMYQVSGQYHPESELGARYDDPAFGIDWMALNPTGSVSGPKLILSDKDQAWPLFELVQADGAAQLVSF